MPGRVVRPLLVYKIDLLISAAFLLFLPLVGMIITGLVVGQTSRDLGLATRAILVGMPIVWFGLIFATEQDVILASSVVSVVSLGLVGLGFVLRNAGSFVVGGNRTGFSKERPCSYDRLAICAIGRRETASRLRTAQRDRDPRPGERD